jgi:hypothetical protein
MTDSKNQQQDLRSMTGDKRTIDENDIIQSLATEQMSFLSRANSRAKPVLSDANTASYAGHTQASIARLTDKIELGPSKPPASRLAPVTDLRDSPPPLGTAQQKGFDPGNRDRTGSSLSLRRKTSRKDGSPASLWKSPRPEMHAGAAGNIEDYTLTLEERNNVQEDVNSPNFSPSGGSYPRDHEDGASSEESQEHNNLPVSKPLGNEDKYKMEDERGLGISQCGVLNYSGIYALTELTDTTREESASAIEMQENASRLTGLEKPGITGWEESVFGNDVDAQKMTRAPKNKAQALNQDVGVQTTDSGDVQDSSNSNNDKLTRLRRELELLTEAVKATPLDNATNALHIKTLEGLGWDIDSSLEVRKLHTSFIQLTEQFGTKVQTLAEHNRTNQIGLAEKETELVKVKKELQATRALERAPDPSLADREDWERIFKSEQYKRNQAELKFPEFKKKAEARYRFDLERLRRELQAKVDEARDKNTRLEERAQVYKTPRS